MIEIRPLASSSRGNAYIVTDGVTPPLLLDCGIPIKELRRKAGFSLAEFAGVLVTHEHWDHCKAVVDLMKAGVEVYMSPGTAAIRGFTGHRLNLIQAKKQFTLGNWTVLPFESEHDAAEPINFLLANKNGAKVLYATDTYYIRYKFQGLTHLLIECNYADDILQRNVDSGCIPGSMRNRILKSHMSLGNLKEFLKSNDLSKVEEIHLIHLSDGNSDVERFKREVEACTGKPVYVAEA